MCFNFIISSSSQQQTADRVLKFAEDKSTMEQYRTFKSMIDDCANISSANDTNEKSNQMDYLIRDSEW